MTNKSPEQEQADLIIKYGNLLCKLKKEHDPLTGHIPSTLKLDIEQAQTNISNFYSNHPNLPLLHFFRTKREGMFVFCPPMNTVLALLVGRLTFWDEEFCYISLAARLCSLITPCSLKGYYGWIKLMIEIEVLRLVDGQSSNPHIGLSKEFLNSFWYGDDDRRDDRRMKNRIIRRNNIDFRRRLGGRLGGHNDRF